jgi:hypothetical protein
MSNGSVHRAPFHVECMPAEIAWMLTSDCSVFWERLMDVEGSHLGCYPMHVENSVW